MAILFKCDFCGTMYGMEYLRYEVRIVSSNVARTEAVEVCDSCINNVRTKINECKTEAQEGTATPAEPTRLL